MSRTRLTDAFAARAVLPPGKAEAVFADADLTGFELRIRGTARTWVYRYRVQGGGRATAPKRLRLGAPPSMNAANARIRAKAAMGTVAQGGDPMAALQEERRKDSSTLGKLLDRYDGELERRQYVNRKVVISGLRTRLKPLLNTDVREVSGEAVASIIDATRRAGMIGAAEDFRSRCRAFFTWCVTDPKVLAHNPLAGHRKQRATRADRIAQKQHGRALSDVELLKVWRAADPATVFGRYLRFLILTGCRRSEGAGLTWSMVDRETEVISLPAVFTKQGRGHDVPITPAVASILDACPVEARSDIVFGSPKTGGRLSNWTNYVTRANKASRVDFQLHDLRRTLRTGMSRIGVSTETAELALGHARSDLESVYNRDGAGAAVRGAFELWDSHVTELQK